MAYKAHEGDTPIDKTYKYLQRVKHIDGMIQKKQEQIDDCNKRIKRLSNYIRVEVLTLEFSSLCKIIRNDIDDLKPVKDAVLNTVNTLQNERQKEVLYRRYFQYMDFFKIAEEMNYSLETIYRLHRVGMEQLAAIMFPDIQEGVNTDEQN